MATDLKQTPEDRPRRRRYDPAFKQAVVEQTLVPGTSVARVAREHGINANQLFTWRRQLLAVDTKTAASVADGPSAALVPVTVVHETPSPRSAVCGSDSQCIEITLPGGEVRIHGAVDGTTLRVVLSSLRG